MKPKIYTYRQPARVRRMARWALYVIALSYLGLLLVALSALCAVGSLIF